MSPAAETSSSCSGDVLWTPPAADRPGTGLCAYLTWLEANQQLRFDGYLDLWQWSIDDIDAFWTSIDGFEGLGLTDAGRPALADARMPGARWFPGAYINYAQEVFRRAPSNIEPALICDGEDHQEVLTWGELRHQVGNFAAFLRGAGVAKGDTVVGYLPNTAVPIVAFLACASIGAIWSVCSPEFGTQAVLNRFAQLRPKIFVGVTRYRYGDKVRDRTEELAEILAGLGTVERIVYVDGEATPHHSAEVVSWQHVTTGDHELQFTDLEFDHPLWVLFSSGTTGLPKGIVHGHGGIVLEHLKTLRLQNDVRAGDRFLFAASTSWMVWNLMVSGLLVGATVIVVDGSPVHPEPDRIWRLAERHQVATLGMGAGLLNTYRNAHMKPGADRDLSALRSIIVTGSPLAADGYRWVHDAVGEHVWLASCSGGTDICSAFVGGAPTLPVRAGRIQAPGLGVAVASWDHNGTPIVGAPGELVVTQPLPSMPLYFWADADNARYRDSYFEMFPGVWRHGDFIEFDSDGSSFIHGRSDSTLNRQGVRMGSAEIYSVVEGVPEVVEALVVGAELGEQYVIILFIQVVAGKDEQRATAAVQHAIRTALSPRHLPDEIVIMPAIPHNRVGKKLEVPVKRLLQGTPLGTVVDPGTVDDLEVLKRYADCASGFIAAQQQSAHDLDQGSHN